MSVAAANAKHYKALGVRRVDKNMVTSFFGLISRRLSLATGRPMEESYGESCEYASVPVYLLIHSHRPPMYTAERRALQPHLWRARGAAHQRLRGLRRGQ